MAVYELPPNVTPKMELVLVDDFLPKGDLDKVLDAEVVADYEVKNYGELGERHYAVVPAEVVFLIQEALALRDPEIENLEATDFSFTRMRPGESLDWHNDQIGERVFAFTLYLNDIDEGIGGHFLAKGVKIQPLRNRLVAFWVGRDSYHCIAELLEGERIALTGWFSNPVKPGMKVSKKTPDRP